MPLHKTTASALLIGAIVLTAPNFARASEPTIAIAPSWTGIYVGGHVGVASGDFAGIFDDAGTEPFTQFGDLDTADILGGVQVGYNFDLGGIVLGIEGDYSWGGLDGSNIDGENDEQRITSDYTASIRGRFGAATDNMMVYLTAGVAFTETSLIVENGTDQLTFDSTGFVYGAGVEYVVMPGVTIRAEALRYDFDENFRSTDQLANGNDGALDGLNDGDDDDHLTFSGVNVARIGLNISPGVVMGWTQAPTRSRGTPANFAGLYVGGNAGWGDTDVGGVFDTAGTAPFAEFALFDMENVNGGVSVGYNFQSGAILFGIEGDYSWNTSADQFVDGENDIQRLESDFIATIRGRVGVVANNMLVYATAGIAFGELDFLAENGQDKLSFSATGLTFGGGIEYKFTDAISLKAEYLRVSFDESIGDDSGFDNFSDGDEDDSLTFKGHDVVRLGLNVKLDGLFSRPAPLK